MGQLLAVTMGLVSYLWQWWDWSVTYCNDGMGQLLAVTMRLVSYLWQWWDWSVTYCNDGASQQSPGKKLQEYHNQGMVHTRLEHVILLKHKNETNYFELPSRQLGLPNTGVGMHSSSSLGR